MTALVAVLALGLAATVVGYAMQRRARRRAPEQRALRSLEAARALIDQGDPQQFSTRVSNAVRDYVEDAFAVRAPRLATSELFVELMADASPVARHRIELGAFLGFCDLARYARWSLSRAEMVGMLDTAQAFVRAASAPPR